MERELGKKFTREERLAAVALTEEKGRSCQSVANEFDVHINTIWKWRQRYLRRPGDTYGAGDEDVPEDVKRMRRRIAELEAEVEFLKKATAYFAKSPP